MNIAIFGYGTIGRGVYKLLNDISSKFNFNVVKVFDIPEKKEILGDKLVCDINDIINDSSIDTVVEVLGGHDLPYEVISKSLKAKKNVVSANKEVISRHLKEFIDLAHTNNVSFLFEASVGGGIPIIRPLLDEVKFNDVTEITGILNGTTNYILSRLYEGMPFVDALKLAQQNGFAERNPSADLEGFDIVRKINILASLAFNAEIKNEDIINIPITKINLDIINKLNDFGYKLRYLASAKLENGNVTITVEPTAVKFTHPLSMIHNEFNAIFLNCTTNGQLMFYGKGAGSIPTATAIVSDIVSICEKRSYVNFNPTNNITINKDLKEVPYFVYSNSKLDIIKHEIERDDFNKDSVFIKILAE